VTVNAMEGFDSGQIECCLGLQGGALSGSAAFSTAQARTGSRSMRLNLASGVNGYAVGAGSFTYVHFGLYIATLPTIGRRIAGDGTVGNLVLNGDGTITVYNASTALGVSNRALGTGRWYWIGWRTFASPGDLLQIDGVSAGVFATESGGGQQHLGCSGSEASAIDIYIDDYISDDAGFLAPSRVGLLLPISDGTITGWTAGGGGTSNMWDGVNNTPPVGATTHTNTESIKSISATNPTLGYVANLQSYAAAAALNGGETIQTLLAIQALMQHGEHATAGTKSCSLDLTNPTRGIGSTTMGLDAGLHGATPSLWSVFSDFVQASPSVTLGTSPTLKVSKIDATTGQACVDFMALVAAWTPFPPVWTPKPNVVYRQQIAG
jgi:hypothetical protein